MVDSVVLIGLVVVALTDALKDLSPKVKGWVTVLAAALIGVLIALVDEEIGATNLSVAQGLMAGLGGAGVVGVAKKVGK